VEYILQHALEIARLLDGAVAVSFTRNESDRTNQ
jgi:hypothetical protein